MAETDGGREAVYQPRAPLVSSSFILAPNHPSDMNTRLVVIGLPAGSYRQHRYSSSAADASRALNLIPHYETAVSEEPAY